MTQRDDTPNRRWVLALTSAASFMVALDSLVITTALSTLRTDLDASIASLEWTVNAYLLSFAVLIITASALGDRYGRRRLFAWGIGLFTVASAACAVAPGVGWLIAARTIQGVGEALVLPLGMALLTAAYPADKRAGALGIFSGVTGLAVLGGPVVGGAIAEGLDWRWIFWINVPIGLALIPLVLGRIHESVGARSAIDVPGVALVTGSTLGLMWGLVRGNSAGWGSLEVLATLIAGGALAFAFVAWERRASQPMLPLAFFRSRAFTRGNAASFFLYASLFGTLFFLAQFLQTAQGYGPLGAGLRLLPWTATLFVTAPIAGSLINRIGERPLITLGLGLQAIGMAWISLVATPDAAYRLLVPPLIVAGVGVSMAMPAVQNVILGAVPSGDAGKASGTFNMVRQLGAAFGIAILVVAFATAGGYGSAQAFSDGFVPAIGASAALSFLGAVAALGLPGASRIALARAERGDQTVYHAQ